MDFIISVDKTIFRVFIFHRHIIINSSLSIRLLFLKGLRQAICYLFEMTKRVSVSVEFQNKKLINFVFFIRPSEGDKH